MDKEWKITEDYIMELEDIIKDIQGILTKEETMIDKWFNEENKDLEKKHRKNYEELKRTRKYCIVKKDITKKIIELQTVNQLLEILPVIAENYIGKRLGKKTSEKFYSEVKSKLFDYYIEEFYIKRLNYSYTESNCIVLKTKYFITDIYNILTLEDNYISINRDVIEQMKLKNNRILKELEEMNSHENIHKYIDMIDELKEEKKEIEKKEKELKLKFNYMSYNI